MPQQFVVPQFIDVEDKIIGPITTRQFIMGIVVALFLFLAYRFADLILFIIEAVVLVGLYVLVAFVKVNGQPFYYFMIHIIRSAKRPALRVWDKEDTFLRVKAAHDKEDTGLGAPPVVRKKFVEQELSSLSLLVDTGGRYRPEEILQKTKERKNGETKEQKNQRT